MLAHSGRLFFSILENQKSLLESPFLESLWEVFEFQWCCWTFFQSSLSLASTWSTWWSHSKASLEIDTRRKVREATRWWWWYWQGQWCWCIKVLLAGERESAPCGAVVATTVFYHHQTYKKIKLLFDGNMIFHFIFGVTSSLRFPNITTKKSK